MVIENDFKLFPEYPPPTFYPDDRLEKEVEAFVNYFITFVKTVSDEVESVVVPILGDYGAGKSHLAKRFVRDLKLHTRLAKPSNDESSQYVIPKEPFLGAYNPLKKFLKRKVAILPVYVDLSKVWKAHEQINLDTIFNGMLTELINHPSAGKDNPNNDLIIPASTMKIIEHLAEKRKHEYPSAEEICHSLLGLKKVEGVRKRDAVGRIVLVVDEWEAILLQVRIAGGEFEPLADAFKKFLTDNKNIFVILCIPPQVAHRVLPYGALGTRIPKYVRVEEFSFEIAKECVNDRKAGIVFNNESIYSCWELSQRGGRNFIRLCKWAATDPLLENGKRKVSYVDIIKALKLCSDLKDAEGNNLFFEEPFRDLEDRLVKQDIRFKDVFHFFVGQPFVHSLKTLGDLFRPKTIKDFLDFCEERSVAELPLLRVPLVSRHYKVSHPGYDFEKERRLMKDLGYKENVDFDENNIIKVGRIDARLSRLLDLFPWSGEVLGGESLKSRFAFIPKPPEDFVEVIVRKTGLIRPDVEALKDLHQKFVSIRQDGDDYYGLAFLTKCRFLNLPIPYGVVTDIFAETQQGGVKRKETYSAVRGLELPARMRSAISGLDKLLQTYTDIQRFTLPEEKLPGLFLQPRGILKVYVSIFLTNHHEFLKQTFESIPKDFHSAIVFSNCYVHPDEVKKLKKEAGLGDIEPELVDISPISGDDVETLMIFDRIYPLKDDYNVVNSDQLEKTYKRLLEAFNFREKIDAQEEKLWNEGLFAVPCKELPEKAKLILYSILSIPEESRDEPTVLHKYKQICDVLGIETGILSPILFRSDRKDLDDCKIITNYSFTPPKYVLKMYTKALDLAKQKPIFYGKELVSGIRTLVGSSGDLQSWVDYFLGNKGFAALAGGYVEGLRCKTVREIKDAIKRANKEILKLRRAKKNKRKYKGVGEVPLSAFIPDGQLIELSKDCLQRLKTKLKSIGKHLKGKKHSQNEIETFILTCLVNKLSERAEEIIRQAKTARKDFVYEVRKYEKHFKKIGIGKSGITLTILR